MLKMIPALVLILSRLALADDVRLSIDTDLVIHPQQMSDVLERAVSELNKKKTMTWEHMDVAVPVKAVLTDLATANAMVIGLDVLDPVTQTINFAANWDEPGLDLSRIDVDDKIKRTVGGVNVILNLKAACENISIRLPGARWQISGSLKWKWEGTKPVFSIASFDLHSQPSTMVADFGRCNTTPELHDEMTKAITQILTTESRLSEVFRIGLLRWVNSQFTNLQAELSAPREYLSANNLSLKWLPQLMTNNDGVIIVRGRLELARSGFSEGSLTRIERDANMRSSYKVAKSGFVLPLASLTAITNFAYSADLLSRRFSSQKIGALESLFKSRLVQAFYWPDLMKFPAATNFWFDLYPEAPPTLLKAEVQNIDGALDLKVKAPLFLRMWEPNDNQFLPYVNFKSNAVGSLAMKVKSSKLQLGFVPDEMNMSYVFAPEYLTAHPKAKTYIRVTSFEKKIKKYLKSRTWEFKMPVITIPGNQQLGLASIELIEQGVLLQMTATPQK